MKLLCIVEHGNAPSIRLRFAQHLERYRRAGIETTMLSVRSALGDRVKAIRAAAKHDVVVLHRVTGFTAMQLALLARANPRLVFDFDDALMFREQKYEQPLRARTFAKFLRTIERCRAVVAGNDFLGSFCHGNDRRVVVLPTPIDVCGYQPRTEHSGRGTVIGWVGLSDGLRYIEQIAPALRQLSAQFPDLRLKIVSDKPLTLAGVSVENEPWSAEREQAQLASFDVGIMPLWDSAWTRGKCSFKILQYMAAGVPVVAAPVGMNAQVIISGANGFLANNADEWVRYISVLIEDPDLRNTFAARGRELIERDYSSERFASRYVELLKAVHGSS